MTLDRLILTNFKNYTEADIELCGNVNCFVGNNGAGKTNLLDAVYYLSFCKSYFNPVDSQNIRQGADFFAFYTLFNLYKSFSFCSSLNATAPIFLNYKPFTSSLIYALKSSPISGCRKAISQFAFIMPSLLPMS